MPEIGEVARIVHYLRKHLVNRKVASVLTQEDDIVYGKVGTSASAFAAAMKGKTVVDARQQGKYLWLVMNEPPHPLLHLGMTGWIKFNNDNTAFYKPAREIRKEMGKEPVKPKSEEEAHRQEEAEADENLEVGENQEWPPRFMKFVLQMEGEPHVEAAFVDGRRLARVRLVHVPADQMRITTPLKENGPDPVIDKDILTADWLATKLRTKRVPVKAFFLDQANISGVGNWVADEVLYHARIHPEQYSNTFDDAQLKQLHESLSYVCTTAVETLADSSKYPADWLMKHRWGKGKKGGDRLPNGERIVHLKVGGRTSAVVPTRQKKTGPVAGDVDKKVRDEEGVADDNEAEGVAEKEMPKRKSRKSNVAIHTTSGTEDDSMKEETYDDKRKPRRNNRGTSGAKAKLSAADLRKKVSREQNPAPNTLTKRSYHVKKTEPEWSGEDILDEIIRRASPAAKRKRKSAPEAGPLAAKTSASKKAKGNVSTERNVEGTMEEKTSVKKRSTRNSTGG